MTDQTTGEQAEPTKTEYEAFLEVGTMWAKADQHELAVEQLDRSIAYRPTAAAHFHRGDSLHALGRLEEAAQAYRDALVLDPEDRGSSLNLADELLCLGRPDEALAIADELLARTPDVVGMRNTAAKANAALGRFDEAFFHWAILLIHYGVAELHDLLVAKRGEADALCIGRAILRAVAARPGVDRELRSAMYDEALQRLEPLLAGEAGDEAALLCARALIDHPERKAEALALVQRALTTDAAEAHCLMGYLLYRGQGVAKDLEASRREHLVAAERGFADSQFELSIYFDKGIGGGVDAALAREWEGRAAAQGQHRACLNVATWAATGAHGAAVDTKRALEYYERGARSGSKLAAARLAPMYAGSAGVEQDLVLMKRWMGIAAALGADDSTFLSGGGVGA